MVIIITASSFTHATGSSVLDGLGYPGTTTLFKDWLLIELFSAVVLYPRFGLLAPAYMRIISLRIMVLYCSLLKNLSRGESAAR
jgi:hypothetical protein